MKKDLLYSLGICVLYLASTVSGATLIKLGHADNNGLQLPILGSLSWKSFEGIVLYGISFLIFTFFISKLKVSIVVPIVSGIYCAMVAVIGVLLFNEKISLGQGIGIALIIIGTIAAGFL